MIVLDHHRVAQPQSVCSAVSKMQSSLVEQSPRRFSRAHNPCRRGAPSRPFLQATRRGSDAAHSLQKIQADALERKQSRFLAFQTQQNIARLDGIAVLLVEPD